MPQLYQYEIFFRAHDAMWHQGITKVVARIQERHTWPVIRRIVGQYVSQCQKVRDKPGDVRFYHKMTQSGYFDELVQYNLLKICPLWQKQHRYPCDLWSLFEFCWGCALQLWWIRHNHHLSAAAAKLAPACNLTTLLTWPVRSPTNLWRPRKYHRSSKDPRISRAAKWHTSDSVEWILFATYACLGSAFRRGTGQISKIPWSDSRIDSRISI